MDILIYADWIEFEGPAIIATLSVVHTRGREIFSYAYDKSWLDKGLAQNLDPDLQFFAGTQYLSTGKKNFGIFLDSSPDRWGRVLMLRREAISARLESRKPKTLFVEDYLLGVFDAHRMGDLARSVAKYFRVSGIKATAIITNVQKAASKWQKVSKDYKISANEQDLMSRAFEKSAF